ncbi:MAG: thioredoxin [marine actinobacterium MedAcidi-G2A]|nr:MAG: thioredoxin [marine actinobacterium MedAcidi-G2A]OUV00498.1 MAG: co-chaperone YbbN [Acidimicrobiaceae bacterium TMED77]|tara:strand:- start:60826 stop:61527 length:702 start_codon:yes stop_codon:yes gene_type:complete
MPDVTDSTFSEEVIERSKVLPVIVDLWAPWCEPCKSLTPIIETVINRTDGKVELAKVNIDENPQVRETFQVQSIPAVYAFRDGAIVDGFMGAQGEDQVTDFVNKLLPSEQEKIIETLLEDGSEESLEEILTAVPDHEDAVIALASLYVETDRSEEALSLLQRIPESPRTRQLTAIARTGDVKLDEILERLEVLLEDVKDDEVARQEFVDLLDVLGPESVEAGSYRRKLASKLF